MATSSGSSADAPAPIDGTQLNEENALTRWRVPISSGFGALVLTLYTDRHTPTAEAGVLDVGGLGGAAARVVGGLLARDWTGAKNAAGDVLRNAADVLSHVHLGIHWKPAKPTPAPPIDQPPGTIPTPNPIAGASQGG